MCVREKTTWAARGTTATTPQDVTGGPGAKFNGRDAPVSAEEWFKEFLENDLMHKHIAKENGLASSTSPVPRGTQIQMHVIPACCEMVNSATVDVHAICAPLSTWWVLALIEWYGCCGWAAIQDITLSMDNCPRMILNSGRKP
jgi:hypothetical protein